MLVAIEPSKKERKVKDLNELSAMSKIKSMLVAFNHVRGHATPIDVNDKDIGELVLVISFRLFKPSLCRALCARVDIDASSSMQLVTKRDQALGVARFDMAAMREEVEAMRFESETLTKYLAEAQASFTVVESLKK
ncbi:hypothetical protein ACFE04_012336 [Oxalis oulophora]